MIKEPDKLHFSKDEEDKYLEEMRGTRGWQIARKILENEMFKAEQKLCHGGVTTVEDVKAQQAIIKTIERALREITRKRKEEDY